MSGTPRIAPIFSNEKIAHPDGRMSDIFRRWFQSFSNISSEYFVTVRRALVSGTRSGGPVGMFQNTTLTTAQRDDIEPTDRDGGMMIFNTTTNKLQVFDGTNWVDLN